VHVSDLQSDQLVEFHTPAGEIRVAGERAILIDATAFGVHRKDLIESLGVSSARAVLTRFGFAQGWIMAEALQSRFNWSSVEDRLLAGRRALMIEGMFQVEPASSDPLSKVGATLVASFEAEQHTAHLGRSDSPTCWMICGMLSGYLSRVLDQEIFVLEERCLGKGESSCCLRARTRVEWEDDRAAELSFFEHEPLADLLDASLHHMTEALKRVEQKLRLKRRVLARITDGVDPLGMVARSSAMRTLISLARRVAKVDSTVLITGESGTGKERIARLVHDESARAAAPFIAINCGAITESLLESELFGHARGAFTGAVQHRAGLFEAASGGTLLLDEIGEVSLGIQVKLLRALQEREVRRVGENRSRATNARVIAATNNDLHAEILAGRFRKDLYYRLNVVELHVPALRERREDILPLARILLAEAALRMNRQISGLSAQASAQLLRYDWPGNVRELENAMERAVALANADESELDDLPDEIRHAIPAPNEAGTLRSLADIEKDYILAVLEMNAGNQTRTAQVLEIGTATLYRKLKQYGALRGQ